MASSAAERRKSKLFLNHIAPVTNTYNELVREKLEPGKFPLTKTGLIKIAGMFVLLLSISLFLGQTKCQTTHTWYPHLLPITLGVTIMVQLILLVIFSWGWIVKSPGFWVYLDLVLMMLLAINCIISSVLTYLECTGSTNIQKIPGPIGMAGGVMLVISCGSIFLMYRYDERENEERPSAHKTQHSSRKSIFA